MSFQQGLSGLNATSKNLEVIGNNIANANTFGAKVARAEFSDMYAAALNGAGVVSIGIGTNLSAVAQQFTQGNITTTDNPMDLAINGKGFFQLVDKLGGNTSYTRNGQFKVDELGFIVTNSNQRLTGIPRGGASGATPVALQLPTGALQPPNATTNAVLELNIDSRKAVVTPPSAVVPDDIKTYTGATAVTLYDLNGTPSSMALYFQKTAADAVTGENTWDVYAGLPGSDPATPTVLTTITFDAAGLPTPDATALKAISLWPSGPPAQFLVTIPDPANPGTTIQGSPTLDLSSITQFAASFAVSDLQQDGYSAGVLASLTVDASGTVNARYTNGQTSSAGTVVLADFRNPQGLQPVGDNSWKTTGAEGEPLIGTPGDGTFGKLQSGALEESNIDLTGELVNMITAQRVYQANAQTIKTQDQILQTLVNLR